MNKPIKLFLALLIFVVVSCDKEEMNQEPIIPETSSDVGEIILGEQINDPYRLENMQQAYNNLISKSSVLKSTGDSLLEPTHNYIRFFPATPEQFELLINDTILNLFCHPLNYEILQGGSYYEDPELPEGVIACFYASIPVGIKLPDVPFEKIYDCFIPEEHNSLEKSSSLGVSFEQLEEESYKITGTITDEELNQPELKANKWQYPDGFFRIANHVTSSWEGVSRVRVKIWRSTKTAWCWTNEDGYYKSGRSFRYDVNYKIKFESRDGFKIWGNWAFTNEATYDLGKHSKGGITRNIARNSGSWKWCVVNNAVQRYREHAAAEGISLPPSDLRVWVLENDDLDEYVTGAAPMTKRCYGNYGFHTTSHFNTFINYITGVNILTTFLGNLTTLVMPDVFINLNSEETEIDNVYRTVFHELAHASHWQKVGNSYWIKYINYILTYGSSDNSYGNGTGLNAEFCGVAELWGNFAGSYFVREEFDWQEDFPLNNDWNGSIGNLNQLLDEDEDWYNPGFLRRCLDIQNASGTRDISVTELYECMVYNTNTFNKLIDVIETKTINDEQVQTAFNDTDTDWP